MLVVVQFGFWRPLRVAARSEDWETSSADFCQLFTAVNQLRPAPGQL